MKFAERSDSGRQGNGLETMTTDIKVESEAVENGEWVLQLAPAENQSGDMFKSGAMILR